MQCDFLFLIIIVNMIESPEARKNVAETPKAGVDPSSESSRPTEKDFRFKVEHCKTLPRREVGKDGRWTGTYDDVLRDYKVLALGDYEADHTAGKIHKMYVGWQPEDFAKLFSLLGEEDYSDVSDLIKMRERMQRALASEPVTEGALTRLGSELPEIFRVAIYQRLQKQFLADPVGTGKMLSRFLDDHHPGLFQTGGEEMYARLGYDLRDYAHIKSVKEQYDPGIDQKIYNEVREYLPDFYRTYAFGDSRRIEKPRD